MCLLTVAVLLSCCHVAMMSAYLDAAFNKFDARAVSSTGYERKPLFCNLLLLLVRSGMFRKVVLGFEGRMNLASSRSTLHIDD